MYLNYVCVSETKAEISLRLCTRCKCVDLIGKLGQELAVPACMTISQNNPKMRNHVGVRY